LKGITFNLLITRLDRRESGTRSQPSHQAIPLHKISIQTTINRYADQSDQAAKSVEVDDPTFAQTSAWHAKNDDPQVHP